MSAAWWAGIAVLGGAGAVARVLLAAAVDRRERSAFPAGILAVNLAGAAALGLLAGAVADGEARRLVAAGLLGSFTTFSTWMLDTHRLAAGRRGLAAVNVAGSLALGLVAVWAGRELGAAL